MIENPYQPPLIPSESVPHEERRGISFLAIFLGVLTDVGGTAIFGVCYGIGLAVFLLSQGSTPEEIQETARSPGVWLIGFVPGMFLTILGGYVAARIAKRAEWLHGVITGCASAAISLLLQFIQASPVWYILASTVIVPPLAMLGAYLARIGRRQGPITESH